MAAPYSQDLRARVLAAADRGMTTLQIARIFCVCPAWVRRVKQRRREFGELTPRKLGNPGVRKVDRDRLAQLVREDPDATLAELRERIGVRCSLSTIWLALKQAGFSFKKRSFTRRSRSGRMWSNAARTGVSGPRTSTRIA